MMRRLVCVMLPCVTALCAATGFAQSSGEPMMNQGQLIYTAHDTVAHRDLEQRFGKIVGSGFETLPAGMLHTTRQHQGKTVRHPLCMNRTIQFSNNEAWLGMAYIPNPASPKLVCQTRFGDATSFWIISTKPGAQLTWMGASPQSPEPRSALVVATQRSTQRPLRPCMSNTPQRTFMGFINDSGDCEAQGNPAGSSYMVPVTQSTGQGAQPFQGWATRTAKHSPHAALQVEAPRQNGQTAIVGALPKRTLCRATINNVSWPGWTEGNSCRVFTYVNNATRTQLAAAHQVYRTPAFPESSAQPFVFHSQGGKPFYACVAWSGSSPLWGFTNDPGACTDGQTTSRTSVKLVRLPAAQGGRA